MSLFRPFKISENVVLSSLDKFTDLVNRNDFNFFKIAFNGGQNFKFESKSSIGIGSINNLIFEPISIKARLILEESETKLILYNTFRLDAAIISGGMAVLIIILLYKQLALGENIPFWINCIMLPSVILFFNWIYYVQERSLKNHIKSILLAEKCILDC